MIGHASPQRTHLADDWLHAVVHSHQLQSHRDRAARREREGIAAAKARHDARSIRDHHAEQRAWLKTLINHTPESLAVKP